MSFTVPIAKQPRRTVGAVGVDRYVTVDTHPSDVVRTLNQMAERGYAYKAAFANLEDLAHGWQRVLFEQEHQEPAMKEPPDRSWLDVTEPT